MASRLGRRWHVLFVLVGMALPAFGNDPEWVEVRSPHFSVVTDAGEKRGRETAMRFEQMRAVFQRPSHQGERQHSGTVANCGFSQHKRSGAIRPLTEWQAGQTRRFLSRWRGP